MRQWSATVACQCKGQVSVADNGDDNNSDEIVFVLLTVVLCLGAWALLAHFFR